MKAFRPFKYETASTAPIIICAVVYLSIRVALYSERSKSKWMAFTLKHNIAVERIDWPRGSKCPQLILLLSPTVYSHLIFAILKETFTIPGEFSIPFIKQNQQSAHQFIQICWKRFSGNFLLNCH